MQIELKNVGFEYQQIAKNSKHAIRNINLNIAKDDEFIFILGHTGSGKSTLVQHLNLLLKPTTGTINILGLNLEKNFKLKTVRKNVGMVFQFSEYQLFEETVLKDVMFGPLNFGLSFEDATVKAKEALKLVGLDESFYDRSPFSLSGGEMRKVAIAGILAYEPSVIVLDEPTAGLDLKSQNQILSLLKELNEKYHKSIIIVSHNMDIVLEYAKRVIVLNNGNLIFDGDKLSLFSNEKLLEEAKLELPRLIEIAKIIKKELQVEFDEYVSTREELVERLEKVWK